MSYIHIAAFWGIVLFLICFVQVSSGDKFERVSPALSFMPAFLFFGAFLLRMVCAGLNKGFDTDISCFASWADRMYRLGPSGFYSAETFTDYPPGYMYVLWGIGALRNILGIEYGSDAHLLLLKLPSILCDLACGYLLYREASRKCSLRQTLFLCAAYLFNPAVILNSSLWGQVDSVFTLCLACMVLCLVKGRLMLSYVAFFAALLIKPQALFLAPILLLGFVNQVLLKDFSLIDLIRNIAYVIIVFCSAVLLCAPYGLANVWSQYFSTVESYPYASVNAYNIWAMMGLNWVSQDNTFLGLPYYIYGHSTIILAIAATFVISVKNRRDRKKYPVLSAFLVISIFLFSVRMHERYLYPAMFFLLLAYIYKPSRRFFLCYSGFSLLHFCNAAHVLYYYDPKNYDRNNPVFVLVGLGMLVMTALLYQSTIRLYGTCNTQVDWSEDSPEHSLPPLIKRRTSLEPIPSRRMPRLKAVDLAVMLTITVLYGGFALYDLGDRLAPATTYDIAQDESLTFDFGENAPKTLSYYIAPWHKRVFALEGRWTAGDEWVYLGDITLENVFSWQEISIEAGVPHLKLTLQESQASLLEFVFLDDSGNVITPVNQEDYPTLFDEQSLHPERRTFRNSMYFDEIYHARTAYEFLNGLYSYENTHPPLGKILIAAGVYILGMNPFGWRIVGTLFGIAMVPLIYLFGRRITSSTMGATVSCILFTFDFMHFTQTRIATIDVYITFFVILMYYFMFCYRDLSFYDTPLWRTFLPLGACGICMGLGIAAKWTGVYAGAGLAVIFFSTLYRRYREYRFACQVEGNGYGPLSPGLVRTRFVPCVRNTILFCIVFFVLIPAGIYLLCYLPFRDNTSDGLFLRMLHNQSSMFKYHSGLDATHSYSSPWYQWPLIVRPIWYFSGYPGGDLREGISAFGNPLVWWTGIPAFLYTVWLWVKERDRTASFLAVGYLAQYLPWLFVTRITFIYHYFPSVVFVALMITHSLMRQKTKISRHCFLLGMILYCAAVFGLFLLFYPVLSGQPIDVGFVAKWLRWFDSWVLVGR